MTTPEQLMDVKSALYTNTLDAILTDLIIDVLKNSDDLYFNDQESGLTDDEYDTLKHYITLVAPTDPYITGVGSEVRGQKVKLPFAMGSLDQIYQGDFSEWITKHNLTSYDLCITDKLDGISAMLIYGKDGYLNIAYSRGNGIMGADITRHVRKIHNIPSKINTNGNIVSIRGELIMPPEQFSIVKNIVKSRSGSQYKNPRNMVAGCINAASNNDVVYQAIDFVSYQIIDDHRDKQTQLKWLNEQQFDVVRSNITSSHLTDNDLIAYLNKQRSTSKYEIDGIVIEVNDADKRSEINPTRNTLNPAYAVKFKVADAANLAQTEVIRVDWNISKDGYYKPRVQFHPVELVGVTIQNASGFNAKFIQQNNIGPGAIINITRSGDVIPFILGVCQPAAAPQMPDDPTAIWTPTGVDLYLPDPSSNETVQFEQLNDFFNTLDVPSLGEGNLQRMFDCGFTHIEDIIELSQEDIISIIGSTTIGKKIFSGIRGKLSNIPMYKLMGAHPAFGRGVGVRKMKKLWETFAGDMTKCQNASDIIAIDGFDEKTANKIIAGYDQFAQFMDIVSPYVSIEPYVAPKQGALTGQTFVFTGFRSKELELKIENLGGKISNSVSQHTTYVVTDDISGNSGKLCKARKLNVSIIDVDTLQNVLNTTGSSD